MYPLIGDWSECVLCPHSVMSACQHHTSPPTPSPSPFFLINPSLQSNISIMADFITSTKVCRNCKRAKPEDQFMSKKNSSISCGRLTVNCLDCRNRQAPRAPKRTAEHAELPPIHRDGPPLIDLQLCTPINPQESILLGTPVATSSRAGATIPSPAGPSIASQEGVQLGTPIESPVSSPSPWPRSARGRYARQVVQPQQSAIE
jgi:hypothetical protein